MKAELIEVMGDDITVVNAARVSFDKQSEWEAVGDLWVDGFRLSDKDTKLISYLAKHNHWTPFSHCMITMRETVPIFVARQRFKHMVGFTYNEVSRRYVDDEPEFYTPDAWRKRPDGSVKQGSGQETIPNIELSIDKTFEGNFGDIEGDWYSYCDIIDLCREWYTMAINRGVAPEQARMILPQSMMTSYYVTGSLAAWARAYKLRIDSHSQKEIQDLAKLWDEIIEPLFPVSWKALIR